MHLARYLPLAALAALAVMAAPASASDPQPNVEVMEEGGQDHGPAVTTGADHTVSGGCAVHATTTTSVTTYGHTGISEVATSTCPYEFVAHINEGGNGYIAVNDGTIDTNAPSCGVTPCDEAGGADHPEYEWPVHIIEHTAASGERLIVTFCLRAANLAEGVIGHNCTLALNVTESGHEQTFTTSVQPCLENPAIEISGTWATEAVAPCSEDEDRIEIEHLLN